MIANLQIIGIGYWKNQKLWRSFVIKIVKKINLSQLLSYERQLQKLQCIHEKILLRIIAYPSTYEAKGIFQ